jgi:hypothetical protein
MLLLFFISFLNAKPFCEMKNYFSSFAAQRDLIDSAHKKMTGRNVKCINFEICAPLCIVYDNAFEKLSNAKKRRGEGGGKIVISIKNHVMAIHIKNYFLLIQPPASWAQERKKNNNSRTTKHSKLINYMPIT